MENNEHTQNQEERSIISIIQEIKQETLNPRTLSKDVRQRCTEFLIGEGYAATQIAQILDRSEKTISRDLAEMRARNALTPSLDMARQIAGELYQKALTHHRYLMRLARSPDADYADKYQSEYLAWRVLKEMVEKFQTLGYLPLKPQEIVEDIFHHVTDEGKEKSITEAKNMLLEIEQVAREAGTLDSQTEKRIKDIKVKIKEAEISYEVDKLSKKEYKPEDKKEEPNNEKEHSK